MTDEIRIEGEMLAGWLGISAKRVTQLAHEAGAKHAPGGWPAGPLVQAHIARLREKADLADAKREVLKVQAERARLQAARAAGALIPRDRALEGAQAAWGSLLAVLNATFSELFHDAVAQGVPAADAQASLEGIRLSLLPRLMDLRDALPETLGRLALDTDERRRGWLEDDAKAPRKPRARAGGSRSRPKAPASK